MMKKIINLIIISLLLIAQTSCLDEDPAYTTNSKVVYEREQSAQLALNGLYGLMAVQGSFAQLIPEVNTEASGLCWTQFRPSTNGSQYINGVIPVDNEFNDLVWGALYQAITNCNIFIVSCNESTAEWKTKNEMIAQAKFLRGVCYYTLYSFYGGVPLRLEPSTRDNTAMARASRQEVIDQIVKDWSEAAEDLSETSAAVSGKPTAPSKYSAYAYLAKLYWLLGCHAWSAETGDVWGADVLKQSWSEMQSSSSYFNLAKEYGDKVIASNAFELEPSFKRLFNGERLQFSKEFVFVINATMNTTENVAYNSLNWTFSPQNSSPGQSWARAQPNKAFFDWAHGTYQDDPRLDATFVSKWIHYVNNKPTDEIKSAYPYVAKTVKDTVAWKDSVLIVGLPPEKVPVVELVTNFVDSIDYRDFTKYEDPRNPKIEELDSLLFEAFAKTKGPSSWNINDWPFFGKHMTENTSGRYADNNLYVYRYADFLLLMADVENELGNTSKALQLANKVLERARNSSSPASVYPKNWTTTSQEEIRENIFHERLFELAAEFDGFNDTRRRGIAWRRKILERNNNHHITRSCYEYGVNHNYTAPWREYWYPNDGNEDWNKYLIRNQLIPIPRKEMSSNDLISIQDQNPGY